MFQIIRDAAIAVFACALVALFFNGLRPSGIDLIASEDYQILVPCPEPMGEANPIQVGEMIWTNPNDLLVDSRNSAQYSEWHSPGSINVPFDYLTPVSNEKIKELAASRAKRVIVIGDGEHPDTGELLAKELAGRGIKNIYFIVGGIDEVRQILTGKKNEQP